MTLREFIREYDRATEKVYGTVTFQGPIRFYCGSEHHCPLTLVAKALGWETGEIYPESFWYSAARFLGLKRGDARRVVRAADFQLGPLRTRLSRRVRTVYDDPEWSLHA